MNSAVKSFLFQNEVLQIYIHFLIVDSSVPESSIFKLEASKENAFSQLDSILGRIKVFSIQNINNYAC